MEIKVKEVSGPGQKSVQEVEEQLLDQHEQNQAPEVEGSEVETATEGAVEKSTPEIGEEDVLSFIKNRYNKEISSFDDLLAQREKDQELPEDVSAFLKYKKETGRGINDFIKLQANYDEMNPDQLLRDYYAATENDLDSDDIDYLMSDRFSYDEDLDEDSLIKQKKIAKKKELAKAKKYFNDLKETYKVPIESNGPLVDDRELEAYNAYKEYISQSQSIQEENIKRAEYFAKKTEELFNDEFKGFEFAVGDQKLVFKPGEAKEVKNVQSDINNFISRFLDDDGMVKDHVGYHKALAAALNPDKLATHFYEKGKADAIGSVSRVSKNIDMEPRSTPQQMRASGEFKVRAIESDSGRGLKIRKR
ncbi:MAG: hypothetical protein ACO393_02885 [Methylophilaceae bacterium]